MIQYTVKDVLDHPGKYEFQDKGGFHPDKHWELHVDKCGEGHWFGKALKTRCGDVMFKGGKYTESMLQWRFTLIDGTSPRSKLLLLNSTREIPCTSRA